jgi:hypothetical protein
LLLALGESRKVTLWDVATGKPHGTIRLTTTGRHDFHVTALAFAPDGQTVITGVRDGYLRVGDIKAGKEVRRWAPLGVSPFSHVDYLALAPSNAVLAAAGAWENVIHLWDVEKGKHLREIRWEKPPGPTREERFKGIDRPSREGLSALALSPDGKTLAATCADGKVRLWEVATGGLRRHAPIKASVLAFAPVGSLLATATPAWAVSPRGAIRLWDWRDAGLNRPRRLTPQALDRLWSKLAGQDAAAGYRAAAALSADPERAVALLGKRLRRVEPMAAPEVARSLAALDDDDFEVRERAFQQLESLGKAGKVMLRGALKLTRSLEVRKQARELLRRMDLVTPDRLRALRSVEVLETLGTAQARRLLARLASGAAGALETEDAKGALKRLVRSQPSKR